MANQALQPPQILLRVAQAVDIVDPYAVQLAGMNETADLPMHGLESGGVLDTHPVPGQPAPVHGGGDGRRSEHSLYTYIARSFHGSHLLGNLAGQLCQARELGAEDLNLHVRSRAADELVGSIFNRL